MSNPERLVFERMGISEEICVTPHSEEMDALRAVGVPRERDIALVISNTSNEWFNVFLASLSQISVDRALAIVVACHEADANLAADVAGGDCDPGFGVDAEDSMRLLELRQAIDAIGWPSQSAEEQGDYLGRLKIIREELAQVNVWYGKCVRLTEQLKNQRTELRRFNREALARKEGNVPLHVTHDRWLQKLHALEQKTALGTANQADLLAIERLKRWLKDCP